MVDAREYHERTNHTPRSVRESGVSLDPATRPHPFKRYEDLPVEPLSAIRPPMQPALAAVAHSRPDPLAGAEQSGPVGTGGRGADDVPPLDRETLATLCYEAAGVKETVRARDGTLHHFRTASCTGNLHHVDLYLACGALDGVEAGLYHFDPASFALEVLREGDYRDALADAVGGERAADVRDAPCSVAVTSTWARNAWKYRERTYRHAFWDSGTVLANLLAAAHALDYRAEVLASFADHDVAELLGVEPEREAPIAIAPIGSGQPAPEAPPVEPIDPAVRPPSEDPAEHPLVHDAWEQSALADAEAAAAFRENCRAAGSIGRRRPSDGARASSDGDRVALDAVDHQTASARPLHHAIQRRGSCREYAREGPSRRQVATVLDRALRGVPADWRPRETEDGAPTRDDESGSSARGDESGSPARGDESGSSARATAPDTSAGGLQFNDAYLLATGVEGLADGAYHVEVGSGVGDPDGHRSALRRLGDVERAAKRHLALDQDWAGDAHANVYLLADVDAVVEALGNRAYRLAQLEAGIALGRLYLATYAHRDLGGTGLTFYDDRVAERLAPEAAPGEGQTPTCLFAFGRRGD